MYSPPINVKRKKSSQPDYTAADEGRKFVSKKLNYEVKKNPLIKFKDVRDDRGNFVPKEKFAKKRKPRYKKDGTLYATDRKITSTLVPGKFTYQADKIGPRYAEYHPDSEGESDSENPNVVYRGFTPSDEDPLNEGFKFAPGADPTIPIETEINNPNGPKGNRIHSTRSRKVALRYAIPASLNERLSYPSQLLEGPLPYAIPKSELDAKNKIEGIGQIAKIMLDPTRDKFDDYSTYQGIRSLPKKSGGFRKPKGNVIGSLKSNQQVVLNNPIRPEQIAGIYDVTPMTPDIVTDEELQTERTTNPYDFVKTRLPSRKVGDTSYPKTPNPTLFHMRYNKNPGYGYVPAGLIPDQEDNFLGTLNHISSEPYDSPSYPRIPSSGVSYKAVPPPVSYYSATHPSSTAPRFTAPPPPTSSRYLSAPRSPSEADDLKSDDEEERMAKGGFVYPNKNRLNYLQLLQAAMLMAKHKDGI